MTSDRDILIGALEPALQAWEKSKDGQSLLGQGPPGDDILSPLTAAIEHCAAYKAVAGKMLFTAYSGPVLHAPSLALPLLRRADRAKWEGKDAGAAADWLIRMLTTREADGTLTAVIWGISVDTEAQLTPLSRIMPFAKLSEPGLKKWITDRAASLWDNSVWMSRAYFDLPGAAIVRRVSKFPYIGADGASFRVMRELEEEVYNTLLFLQGKCAARPLVLGYWFDYEDPDLDLNAHDNYVAWMLPEVEPTIPTNTATNAATIASDLKTLRALSPDWQDDLKRSMARFALSQCRRQLTDRVLDLALAFEIAVSRKGDQAPPSWKVSVRTAQMIGGTLAERLAYRRKIAGLYGLRNKSTHGSKLDGDQRTNEATVADANALYSKLLDAFWRLGSRPDWEAIELEPPSVARA